MSYKPSVSSWRAFLKNKPNKLFFRFNGQSLAVVSPLVVRVHCVVRIPLRVLDWDVVVRTAQRLSSVSCC